MDALAESNRSLTAPFGALVLMLMMCSYSKSPKSTENSSSSLTRQLKPPLPTGPINSQIIHGLSLTQIASRNRSAERPQILASEFVYAMPLAPRAILSISCVSSSRRAAWLSSLRRPTGLNKESRRRDGKFHRDLQEQSGRVNEREIGHRLTSPVT